MQFSTILSLVARLSLGAANPTPQRVGFTVIGFHGAAGAGYSLAVPLDGANTLTNNALSISSITSNTINIGTQCTLNTVGVSPKIVEGPVGTWTLGPPETVTSISCHSAPRNPPRAADTPQGVFIEFDGADPSQGAKYSIFVSLTGQTVGTGMLLIHGTKAHTNGTTGNSLSISTIVSTYAKLQSNCHFEFVDSQATLVLIRPDTWAVGPPQGVKSVSCHL